MQLGSKMQLFLFGTLRLVENGQDVLLSGQTAVLCARLAWQAVRRQPATRSQLAGQLYPDLPENHARCLLTNTLYRLKRAAPQLDPHLAISQEFISLANMWIDVAQFEAGLKTADLQQQTDALLCYNNDLLPHLDEAWLTIPRATLRAQFLNAVPTIVQQLQDQKENKRKTFVSF